MPINGFEIRTPEFTSWFEGIDRTCNTQISSNFVLNVDNGDSKRFSVLITAGTTIQVFNHPFSYDNVLDKFLEGLNIKCGFSLRKEEFTDLCVSIRKLVRENIKETLFSNDLYESENSVLSITHKKKLPDEHNNNNRYILTTGDIYKYCLGDRNSEYENNGHLAQYFICQKKEIDEIINQVEYKRMKELCDFLTHGLVINNTDVLTYPNGNIGKEFYKNMFYKVHEIIDYVSGFLEVEAIKRMQQHREGKYRDRETNLRIIRNYFRIHMARVSLDTPLGIRKDMSLSPATSILHKKSVPLLDSKKSLFEYDLVSSMKNFAEKRNSLSPYSIYGGVCVKIRSECDVRFISEKVNSGEQTRCRKRVSFEGKENEAPYEGSKKARIFIRN